LKYYVCIRKDSSYKYVSRMQALRTATNSWTQCSTSRAFENVQQIMPSLKHPDRFNVLFSRLFFPIGVHARVALYAPMESFRKLKPKLFRWNAKLSETANFVLTRFWPNRFWPGSDPLFWPNTKQENIKLRISTIFLKNFPSKMWFHFD
jgi:hypothetical protein